MKAVSWRCNSLFVMCATYRDVEVHRGVKYIPLHAQLPDENKQYTTINLKS